MVALYIMVLPTTRAPTQVTCLLLKIVFSLIAFRRSAQHKTAAAFPFGFRRTVRLYFKNLTPVLERAAYYTC